MNRMRHWEIADARAAPALVREHVGRRLRVEGEDGGYRLYIDDQRRGFFDSASHACAHGELLAARGAPPWRETLCPGPHHPDQPRPAVHHGLCAYHRAQAIRGVPLTLAQRRRVRSEL